MKIINILIICTTFMALAQASMAGPVTEPVSSPHLVTVKGDWFLRATEKCIPIRLDRKGRSDYVLGDREIFMDKRDDYLYLTLKKYFHTYTYRMNPLEWGTSYVLELVAAAPRVTPTPKDAPLEERYTGIFRAMVDCQLGPPATWAAVEGDSRWR